MRSLFTALLVVLAFSSSAEAKPNIVFILADDLGYTDVACFGSKYYETPNIDKLAAQGMKLTNPTKTPMPSHIFSPMR